MKACTLGYLKLCEALLIHGAKANYATKVIFNSYD